MGKSPKNLPEAKSPPSVPHIFRDRRHGRSFTTLGAVITSERITRKGLKLAGRSPNTAGPFYVSYFKEVASPKKNILIALGIINKLVLWTHPRCGGTSTSRPFVGIPARGGLSMISPYAAPNQKFCTRCWSHNH